MLSLQLGQGDMSTSGIKERLGWAVNSLFPTYEAKSGINY